MGHHVGSKKEKQKKQNSLMSPLSAILCNDIIACFTFGGICYTLKNWKSTNTLEKLWAGSFLT